MRQSVLLFMAMFFALSAFAAPDDYARRQAESYMREAEYYQRKAASHRREAEYYLKRARSFEREAAYYSRRGDASRAADYSRRASQAMDRYETEMRRAGAADEKAADYLRRAARLLDP